MLSKTSVHHFAGSNVALGTAAGKMFRVGCVPPVFALRVRRGFDSFLVS